MARPSGSTSNGLSTRSPPRWAAGVQGFSDDRVDPLYDGGRIVGRFRHRQEFLEVYGGLSPGLVDGNAARWLAGFTVDRNRFSHAQGFGFVPPERLLAYPWIGYHWIEDGYTVERDLNRLERSEDYNLGRQLGLRLGFSSPTFGGDRDQAIFTGTASAGWRPAPAQILLGSLFTTARVHGPWSEPRVAAAAS